MLDRLELLLEQIQAVEAERDAWLAVEQAAQQEAPAGMLLRLSAAGPETVTRLDDGGQPRLRKTMIGSA